MLAEEIAHSLSLPTLVALAEMRNNASQLAKPFRGAANTKSGQHHEEASR
jgi:hypothetical protein